MVNDKSNLKMWRCIHAFDGVAPHSETATQMHILSSSFASLSLHLPNGAKQKMWPHFTRPATSSPAAKVRRVALKQDRNIGPIVLEETFF
jgi:hypothetical protein